ncbi:Murein DD-endopeptidase MepM and murein hydrolase activator NlpD, contain LysM domain [Cognatiyoonia koreensis]|uniref:Murein DD-endopeptidase MepM and murein hydrolase activator NlpD, contain LysM domain n=1 Tax=Cognatiyoonia koreensis TaxID=364200 RepID=A0A1I0PT74_9RHOB|nr:peptidoglycan DD-metalloendopeptidase family protein [Cognatiyoonia koreensis]SEW17615.1 Murein DD-endopeptidase MepM and murein hydrolase activator NlpD, contain LysM domain [Cognatiyoonia koreensis]
MANGRTTRILLAGVASLSLVACESLPDWDLRDLGEGFDTSAAVENLPDRPRPDDRGVISYPNYQVVVSRPDDTIRTIAARLNLDANELGSFNGIAPDTPLRRDELIALPTRVTEPSPATGAATTGPIQPLDVTAVATTALDRVGTQPSVTTTPITAPAATVPPPGTGTEPIRHQVKRGETAFSISRLYNVPVRNIAEWNGLSSDLSVREGQQLLIPQAGAPAPRATPVIEEPGQGSETPVPPSASAPLPEDDTSPDAPQVAAPQAPDLGTPTPSAPAAPATNASARFAYPVQGSIIRAYAPGRNEGIDIGVPAGTSVKAAGPGTVAAITTDTQGVPIVVIKHPDNLLTVYTNLEGLTVSKDETVSSGKVIGKVRAGSPSFLHFEVRRGLQSVDPADFLP